MIAVYGNVKAVLQCKKYSQPVGNAAVQEIIAGKSFEQAQVAAVVSNANFTPSAKQLASTTGVFLLHFSELPQFAKRLGLVEESQLVQQSTSQVVDNTKTSPSSESEHYANQSSFDHTMELVEKYGITFDGDRYAYGENKYDNMSDAINYAKLQIGNKGL